MNGAKTQDDEVGERTGPKMAKKKKKKCAKPKPKASVYALEEKKREEGGKSE